MKEQFVTYEIALKLKELGFDEECFAIFFRTILNNGRTVNYISDDWESPFYKNRTNSESNSVDIVSAPLWQQVIDWFLKKKHLYIDITFKEVKGPKIEGINSVYFDIEIYSIFGGDAWKKYRFSEISDDYYYAREQAILKAIELCKDKKF